MFKGVNTGVGDHSHILILACMYGLKHTCNRIDSSPAHRNVLSPAVRMGYNHRAYSTEWNVAHTDHSVAVALVPVLQWLEGMVIMYSIVHYTISCKHSLWRSLPACCAGTAAAAEGGCQALLPSKGLNWAKRLPLAALGVCTRRLS